MSPWTDAAELRADVTAMLERFAETPEGTAAAQHRAELATAS